MLELPVTSLGLPEQAKADALQGADELAPLDHGHARRCHAASSEPAEVPGPAGRAEPVL